MPICKNPKCNKNFPNRMEIDGKVRFLNKRKYCLKCSPFKKHRAWKLDQGYVTQERFGEREFVCKTCGKQSKTKSRNTECNACRTRKTRERNKKKAIEYKGGKCSVCGYDRYYGSLDFHHKDPSIKEFTVSQGWQCSWDKLKKEIDKCELVCSNCHGEIHADLIKVKRS